jgi:hypothetical protein
MHCTNINLNIDYDRLVETFYNLDLDTLLDADPFQLAVQCREHTNKASQLYESCGSLFFDWQAYEKNPTGKMPLRKDKLKEQDFIKTCDLFQNTYIENVIDTLKSQHNIVRGRFMKMKHKTCLTMHVDKSKRIHIPIYTNNDCMMIINENIVRMPFGSTYLVDTTVPHTALNASKNSRVHLVFCIA